MSDHKTARTLMIEGQLRPNRITDPSVLAAFGEVAREDFVAPGLEGAAYIDGPIAAGDGRFLIEPVALARMVQEAGISPRDHVLVIGCATGYGVAIVSRLAEKVVGIDDSPVLIERARMILGAATHVTFEATRSSQGFPAAAPYDVILIEGGVPAIPDALTRQLAEKGRLLAAIHSGHGNAGELVLMERLGESVSRLVICDASLKPLPGFMAAEGFVL